MTVNQTTAPFGELHPGAEDSYDLSIYLSIDVCRYPDGDISDMQATDCDFGIEATRDAGGWSLRVSRWNGEMQGDDVLTGPSLLELRDQTTDTDPLTLLRALLSGQTV